VKTRTTSYMQNTISPILNKFERFSPNMWQTFYKFVKNQS
jgi:hypothetical protein